MGISPEAKYHLTFDIDWAPDCSIAEVLNYVEQAGVKATFFVTHETDLLSEIAAKGHHLGVHPNFLPNSSHGDTPFHIIENVLKMVPDATVMRTHALVQSSILLHQIFKEFSQLKLDLSIFMYRFAHVGKFKWYFDDVSFDRLNYNWEDDVAFADQGFDWSKPELFGDVNILDFHPIHVSLNSRNNDPYKALKKDLAGTPMFKLEEKTLHKHRNPENGTATYLKAILNSDFKSIRLTDIS